MTKIFFITIKGLEPVTTYIRVQDATTVPVRHMWETGSSNWLQFQFMLQWFIRFPKFTEFLYHLGKTSLYLIRPKQLILIFLTTYMYKKNSKGRHSDCNYSRVTERQTIVMWKMQKQSSHEGYFHNGCSPNWAHRSMLRYLRHLQHIGSWEIVLIVSSLWRPLKHENYLLQRHNS